MDESNNLIIMPILPIHSNVKQHIIQALEDARFLIYGCIAWFNDNDIYSVLLEKANDGLIVELIVRDDSLESKPINFYSANALDFSELLRAGGKVYLLQENHNKYAIVDLKTTIAGSYNWTIGADRKMNGLESITISKSEYLAAEIMAEEFIRLRNLSIPYFSKKECLIKHPSESTINMPIEKAVQIDAELFKLFFSDGVSVYCTKQQVDNGVLMKQNDQIKINENYSLINIEGSYWLCKAIDRSTSGIIGDISNKCVLK